MTFRLGRRQRTLNPDFTWLTLGSGISQLGSVSAMATFPLLALSMSDSPILAGWVTAAGTFPPLLLQLPAGVLIEQSNYRRIMIISQSIRVASALMLLAAFLAFDAPVAALLIAAAVEGTCAVFYGTAELTSVPRVVQHELLPIAIARNEARSQGALSVGRPLGPFLMVVGNWAPSLLNLVAGIAALISVRRLNRHLFEVAGIEETGVVSALKRGLSTLWERRFLRAVVTVCMATNFLFQIVILLFIVLAKDEHRSALFMGFILAASGVGGLVGAFVGALTAEWQFAARRRRLVLLSWTLAWLALTGVIAFTGRSGIMVFAWGGIGFVGANVNVALNLYQAREIDKRLLARVASTSNFISRGSAGAGALCAGYVVARFGPQQAAYIVFGLMLALTVTVAAIIYCRREPETGRPVRKPSSSQPEHSLETV